MEDTKEISGALKVAETVTLWTVLGAISLFTVGQISHIYMFESVGIRGLREDTSWQDHQHRHPFGGRTLGDFIHEPTTLREHYVFAADAVPRLPAGLIQDNEKRALSAGGEHARLPGDH